MLTCPGRVTVCTCLSSLESFKSSAGYADGSLDYAGLGQLTYGAAGKLVVQVSVERREGGTIRITALSLHGSCSPRG